MSIIVIGSLNMDMVVYTKKMPLIGETIKGENFLTNCGGKGANQAVAIGKLTDGVSMIGAVGNDVFGNKLISSLTENGINVENIIKSEISTGTAMIVVVNGDNFIVIDEGANGVLNPSYIDSIEDIIKQAEIMVLQLEIPMDVVEKSIELAKKHGVKVLLNPAPVTNLSDFIYENVDILVLNETEAESLTGIRLNSDENIKLAIKCLTKKGSKQVIITLGADGVSFNLNDEIVHKSSIKVDVVDTTSAGDSFIGAIVAKISCGESISNAIDFAVYAAALTVTKSGAQISLPTLEEVDLWRRGFNSNNYKIREV